MRLESSDQSSYIWQSDNQFVRQIISVLLMAILLTSTIPGCLSDLRGGVSLVVNYEQTNGTVVESYVDGEHVSTTNASLEFDFSNTESESQILEFGVDFAEGRDSIAVNPDTSSSVIVEFANHGIYEIVAYAIDENNKRESTAVTIRIDLKIEWSEQSTHEPSGLSIDPIPKHGGPHPVAIFIDSTVENPELIENIGGGREVEITWRLYDQAGEACLVRNGVVEEGGEAHWEAFHYNTYEIHELRISYEEGQDNIDVEQSISLVYEHIESDPNP